jgi:RNA polymerase sigma-70 factor (ECF subfamily)
LGLFNPKLNIRSSTWHYIFRRWKNILGTFRCPITTITADIQRMIGQLKKDFEAFQQATSRKLRAYIRCACSKPEDAEDLVQDCYLRALRGWGQFNGHGSRQAWLFGIARRTCVDWYRHKGRQPNVVSLENTDQISDLSKSKNKENTEQAWQAIEHLESQQREVIHLRFAAGLSYAEIAQTLEVPIGTVRSRLHRGLKAVRKQIMGNDNET